MKFEQFNETEEAALMLKILNEHGIKCNAIPNNVRPKFSIYIHSVNVIPGIGQNVSERDISKLIRQISESKLSYYKNYIPSNGRVNEFPLYSFFLDENDCISALEEIKHGAKIGLIPDFEGCSFFHTSTFIPVDFNGLKEVFKIAVGDWDSNDDRIGTLFTDRIL